MNRVLVTGANGHLGRRLIPVLLAGGTQIVAVVRRERARERLENSVGNHAGLRIHVLDPSDPAAIAGVAADCSRAVHLIGTIRETPGNTYADTHQRPVRALLDAVSDTAIQRIVYLSILGADAPGACRCLAARAAVEHELADAPVASSIVRVPMVLGEGDRASAALARRAGARLAVVFRAASLEQPIYAGDVVDAIIAALDTELTSPLDLAGPESLARRELIDRAAGVLGSSPVVLSLPFAVGLATAQIGRWLNPAAPITADMLRVLNHDDAIDPAAAATTLGITLTALDDMLARVLMSHDQPGT